MATPQGWTSHAIDTGPMPVSIFTRGDTDHLVAVPARPLLAHDASGRPKLSLTLMLSRRPAVDSPLIEPLITQGLLAFTVTLALPEDALRPLEEQAKERIQPLFARAAAFNLAFDDRVLQQVDASGPGATASFSVTLSREAALSTLAALRNKPNKMTIDCQVEYSLDDRPRHLRLQGSYQDIYEHLISEGRRPLTRALLEAAIATMVFDGTLRAESTPEAATTDTITDAFLKVSNPVLQRVTAYDGQRYSPRPPADGQMLDITLREGGGGRNSTVTLMSGLEELFHGLDGLDPDLFLHLVSPGRTGAFEPVPRRQVQPPPRAIKMARALGTAQLARIGTATASLTAVARPSAIPAVSAHVLLADATVQPAHVAKLDPAIRYSAVDNLMLQPAVDQPPELSLPVVDDASAPLWPDRIDANLRWYAPALLTAAVEPNADPQTSAFLFAFRTAGHTTSGSAGLEGTIRFRLQRRMSDATRTAWEAAGKPTAKPINLLGLSVTLCIPFRDQNGATHRQAFTATLTTEGDNIIAEVAMLDDWVRLAYGALSAAGFQNQAPTLSVAYTFWAYVPVSAGNLSLLFDRKQAITPVIQPHAAVTEERNGAFLDAGLLTYRTPSNALRFNQEQVATPIVRPHLATFAIRPELAQATAVNELLQQRRHGLQSIAREATENLSYPCATLGAFYVQDDAENGRVAIGCRDAFRLGQIEYRQYRRIDALDDPAYSVWRSLQQPGRFLLVPTRWSIARFASDDPQRAYRPTILVYSTIDAEVPINNRCAVLASLVPDISPAKRRALMRALGALAQTPALTLINEIDAELEYAWALPASSGMDIRVAKLFDSFQVTVGTGIDTMAQLQAILRTSGLVGTTRYRLPDGSIIESTLALDLNRIVGPLPDGPIQVDLAAPRCTLTNRIERAVDVSDLIVEAADGRIETVRIDKRLAADATTQSVVAADIVQATPIFTMAPGDAAGLTEIRSFVEDVHTNAAFVNLVNYANHNLAALALQARLRGVPGIQTLALNENEPVDTLEFVLPLTTYLADPVLELAVTKTMKDGTAVTTDWLPWSFNERGNVVSLTWELIRS